MVNGFELFKGPARLAEPTASGSQWRSQILAPAMSAVPAAAIRTTNIGACKTYSTPPTTAAPPMTGSKFLVSGDRFCCLTSSARP